MYQDKFVVAVKVGGRVLRENGDTVSLPYGIEYSIYLKNLSGQRASVTVSIDGTDVLNGHSLIIDPNKATDLERFVGDSLNHGRKLKFIERTSEIEQHRGIEADDGIVRVAFKFEQQCVFPNVWGGNFRSVKCESGGSFGTVNNLATGDATSFMAQAVNCSASANSGEVQTSAPVNDIGITVEGSKSSQSFQHGYIGPLENVEHVIVLKLKGGTAEHAVTAPVTVKTKKLCTSCGRKFDSSFEYCPKDGTYLRAE